MGNLSTLNHETNCEIWLTGDFLESCQVFGNGKFFFFSFSFSNFSFGRRKEAAPIGCPLFLDVQKKMLFLGAARGMHEERKGIFPGRLSPFGLVLCNCFL